MHLTVPLPAALPCLPPDSVAREASVYWACASGADYSEKRYADISQTAEHTVTPAATNGHSGGPPPAALEQVTFPGDVWVVREKGGEERELLRHTATAETLQWAWVTNPTQQAGLVVAQGAIIPLPTEFSSRTYGALCICFDAHALEEYLQKAAAYDEIFHFTSEALADTLHKSGHCPVLVHGVRGCWQVGRRT